MGITTSAARIIDPILTTVAQGYQNNDLVGNALFPRVAVPQRGGKILQFGKESFLTYDTQRAPGSVTKRLEVGYSTSTYSILDYSLDAVVPREILEESGTVPINLASASVRTVQDAMALRLEVAQATLATTAANYDSAHKTTLSGTSQWSDFSGVSDPINDIAAAIDAIRVTSGKLANTVILPAAVLKSLRMHPKIIDRIKYTGRDIPTVELLASLFGVARVLVANAIKSTDAGVFSDVWGKYVVVAYTDMSGMADMGRPTFGYTYGLGGYPLVERSRFEENIKSWIYGVSDAVQPVIASPTSGYLISAAVA